MFTKSRICSGTNAYFSDGSLLSLCRALDEPEPWELKRVFVMIPLPPHFSLGPAWVKITEARLPVEVATFSRLFASATFSE